MKNVLLIILFNLVFIMVKSQNIPSKNIQIKTAVMAAPEAKREGAKVYGYEDNKLIVLREGTNDIVCIADNPAAVGINIPCKS